MQLAPVNPLLQLQVMLGSPFVAHTLLALQPNFSQLEMEQKGPEWPEWQAHDPSDWQLPNSPQVFSEQGEARLNKALSMLPAGAGTADCQTWM